jgi:uncharacterized protein YgiB involved in biofilm formation
MALSACGGDAVAEAQVFGSVAECTAAGIASAECVNAFTQAQADNNNDAPRFESLDLCEGEFGNGQCQQRFADGGGGGSFWVPLLGGFMIANAIDDIDIDGSRKRKYAPIYRGKSGWYSGGTNYGPMSPSSGGRYSAPRDTFARPASAPRVQTRADITSRGGFGGRASSRGGSGG